MDESDPSVLQSLLVASLILIAASVSIVITATVCHGKVLSGKHAAQLGYRRLKPAIKLNDRVAARLLLLVIASQLVKVVYLCTVAVQASHLSYDPPFNYAGGLNCLQWFLLCLALVLELREWIKQFLYLRAANNLIGTEAFNTRTGQTLEYYTVYLTVTCLLMLVYLVIGTYNTGDGTLQQMVSSLCLGVPVACYILALMLLLPALGFLVLGYRLWRGSSREYGHDVEDMRKRIETGTVLIIVSLLVNAMFLTVEGAL